MAQNFINNATGEKVQVIDEDTTFYTLDTGAKIKKDSFINKYRKSEEIDPDSFLKSTSAIGNLAEEIRSFDTSKIQEDKIPPNRIKYTEPTVLSDNSRTIEPVDNVVDENIQVSEDRKQQMIEEWKRKNPQENIVTPVKDENFVEFELPEIATEKNQSQHRQTERKREDKVDVRPTVDPLQMMFKMFKNNYEVDITIGVKEKIANPEFIKMVMENVDGDAIEYYSKIILDKVLKEPLKLKKDIYEQLKKEIYGDEPPAEKEDKKE